MTAHVLVPPEPPGTAIHDPRRRRDILIAVCLALMAVIASVTGLNVAQPQLALALDATQSQVLWLINIYTVSLAALLLPLGALGDRRGRRPMLLAGLAVFGVANAMAALAPSFGVMLAARFLAGVGAAMIMPVTLAVITATFPEEERARAIGAWSAVAGGGGLLGMLLSAVLADYASWRALFILPLALVAAAAVMTVRAVPASREVSPHRFDVVGAVASILAVGGLSCALHAGPEQGWFAPATLLSLALGGAGAVGFVLWEWRCPAPLLDLSLFRHRGLASGSLVLLVGFGVQAGVVVVLFPFLQAVLGWSGLRATLALLPMALLMMLAAGLAPRLTPALGAPRTMQAGIFLSGAGLALMAALISVDGGYRALLPGLLIMGLGMGLSMTPATTAITAALPRERQGVASALNDVSRELGTALGVALLGAVFATGYRHAVDSRMAVIPPTAADAARSGIASALAAAQGTGPEEWALIRAAQEAFVEGWRQAMWLGVGLMALLLVYALVCSSQRAATGAVAPAVTADEPGGMVIGRMRAPHEGKACS